MASDSNLSSREGNSGFGQKVFPIPYLNAALTYSGLYQIMGNDLDKWMTEYINNDEYVTETIEEFVRNLTSKMNTDFQSSELVIMHICGYSRIDFQSHLEHWHISNTSLDHQTGDYLEKDHFDCSNDFNSRTNSQQRDALQNMDFHPDKHKLYINGFPPGRKVFMAIRRKLENVLNEVSSKKDWDFRPPKNIFESANKVKMYFFLVSEMFKMSDYDALFVGGDTQTYLIPVPPDLKK